MFFLMEIVSDKKSRYTIFRIMTAILMELSFLSITGDKITILSILQNQKSHFAELSCIFALIIPLICIIIFNTEREGSYANG